jgi:alkaline phosphatase
VRKVLEESGNVLAVLQGHSHKNDHKDIAGIHYCTLVAMVEGSGAENNGYSVMYLANDGTLSIKGFRKQDDYVWT